VAGAEFDAGASGGIVPIQSLWFLAVRRRSAGSRRAIRGQISGAAALEVANSFPGARSALFSDAGGGAGR